MENSTKLLLLGDQAIALGAIHAGISGVYAYLKLLNIYKNPR